MPLTTAQLMKHVRPELRPDAGPGGVTVSGRLQGIEDLDEALSQFSDAFGDKLMREGLKAGGEVIAEEARKTCPAQTGTLRDSIQVRAGRSRGVVNAQVVCGRGWYKGQTFYGAFVEFGHLAGSRKLGNARAHVPAHPFLRPAAMRSKDAAAGRVTAVLRAAIDRQIARLRKKGL